MRAATEVNSVCSPGPVVHAAYNPRMFRPKAAGHAPHMVLATGGQDQRVVVWHEAYSRPRVVGTRLFRCASAMSGDIDVSQLAIGQASGMSRGRARPISSAR